MPIYLHEEVVKDLLGEDPHFRGLVSMFERAFVDYANGDLVTPPQERVRLVWPPAATVRPYARDMRILPAMLPGMGVAGVRIGCASIENPSMGYTLLLDFETMQTLAVIEDHYLHGVRSGISAGVAARHLANPDARALGVVGNGRISEVQLAATLGQRQIETIRVFSRDRTRRIAFAKRQQQRYGVEVIPAETVQDVIENSDILVSATNSHRAPVFDGHWLSEGTLLTSVTPGELDATTALRSRVIVTSKNRVDTDYTAQEPLDSLLKSGELDWGDIQTLGDVVTGRSPGRRSRDEIVLLFSPGIGILDVAAAKHVFELADAAGAGVRL